MVEPLREHDPRRMDGYRLTGFICEGEQGVVYAGRSPKGAPVAVKLLHVARPLHADDYEERTPEKLAAQISAVMRAGERCAGGVLDSRLDVPRPYIVTRLIEGPNLFETAREHGPMPEPGLHRLALETAEELAALHKEGYVCGFIKPMDVILNREGPRLTGLGITFKAWDVRRALRDDAVYSWISWMPPELLRMEDSTPAADVYGWGLVVLFAATGGHVFPSDTGPALIYQALFAAPDVTALPAPLRPLVSAALAKDPADRPDITTILAALGG
ncbi:protein kinase [Actinocorallia sp. B10E7]|uniref:protein kinase domain-containing protein n=1 Tax=Actinocorallia sp. B10E7 TaxID=3153558 RepID=UPI00325E653E